MHSRFDIGDGAELGLAAFPIAPEERMSRDETTRGEEAFPEFMSGGDAFRRHQVPEGTFGQFVAIVAEGGAGGGIRFETLAVGRDEEDGVEGAFKEGAEPVIAGQAGTFHGLRRAFGLGNLLDEGAVLFVGHRWWQARARWMLAVKRGTHRALHLIGGGGFGDDLRYARGFGHGLDLPGARPPSEKDDFGRRVIWVRANSQGQLESIHDGHQQIGDDDIGMLVDDVLEGFVAIASFADGITAAFERARQELSHFSFIIYD